MPGVAYRTWLTLPSLGGTAGLNSLITTVRFLEQARQVICSVFEAAALTQHRGSVVEIRQSSGQGGDSQMTRQCIRALQAAESFIVDLRQRKTVMQIRDGCGPRVRPKVSAQAEAETGQQATRGSP